MENSAELSTDNQTGPSETVELHSGENWTKERSFGDFLKSFETLKIESEDIARNVGETGDLSNVPAQRMYEEQLESAMSKMGLTMDDYLKARSVWSGDAAFDDKADATGPTSDQELSKLGLNEEEIRELPFFPEKEKMRDSLSNRRTSISQLLGANFDAVSIEQDKIQQLLEDIRKDTEYIQEIPKWQLEMQKRLDMLKQMRLRRVAELTASLQVEKEEHKELEKVQTPPPPTSDDKAGRVKVN
ncbi:hypothetical protein TcWFU_005456 [Taenia crassiceps]|uniref:Uncharacterized protein n=1 Tax=Taenia crassiceps TaxID=6207 RepID=A0ABR4Q9E2_9CEST